MGGVEPFLQDVWDLAKTAGPFATLFTLYILREVNRERKSYRDERSLLLERVLSANAAFKQTIDDAITLLTAELTKREQEDRLKNRPEERRR